MSLVLQPVIGGDSGYSKKYTSVKKPDTNL